MRLLIVEDEYYTRQGIIDEIDLAALGFDEVQQADDGVNAVRAARTFRPDVVLADVRMPRMDGVEMGYALRRIVPDCTIVFMSGYADKEYLKAAIDLRAASYIEKPFRTAELRDVLERAATLRAQARERERRDAELLQRADAGDHFLRSRAALLLVQSDLDDPRIRQALEACDAGVSEDTALSAALVRPAGVAWADEPLLRESFGPAVERVARRSGLGALVATRGSEAMLVVLAASPSRRKLLGAAETTALIEQVLADFPAESFVAGIGGPATGPEAGRLAFAAASSSLDAAFFGGAGSVCHDETAGREPLGIPPQTMDAFQSALDREDGPSALALLRERKTTMAAARSRDAEQARECLVRMLLRLVAFCERHGVDPSTEGESVRVHTERIERAGTLEVAAEVVLSAITRAFARLEEHAAEGRMVSRIKRSIHRGYATPGLSIEEIAATVGISPTYACRLFKEATGETIHRYITAYRLERAKDLLLDPRMPKMTEVAARAGFSDPNYFARAFRRETGQSPSEFRASVRR